MTSNTYAGEAASIPDICIGEQTFTRQGPPVGLNDSMGLLALAKCDLVIAQQLDEEGLPARRAAPLSTSLPPSPSESASEDEKNAYHRAFLEQRRRAPRPKIMQRVSPILGKLVVVPDTGAVCIQRKGDSTVVVPPNSQHYTYAFWRAVSVS